MAKRINEYKVEIKVTDGSCPKSCWNTKCSECGKFIGIKIDEDGKEYLSCGQKTFGDVEVGDVLQYVDQQGAFSLQSGTITITGKEYEDNGSEIRFSANYDDGNGTIKFTANPNKAVVSDGDYFDSITVEVP